ncbi:MAG: aldo/keto reductase, partial [Candidatus Latescibacteria bacterium]|nr:aldo/keto reductase [Candidatus Latescibacterota bacterium]
MDYRTLGRTGLRVSLMGMGTGGPSNFGQSTGVPEDEIKRLVRRALDLGINFFDSSAAYKESEAILGRALEGVPRDEYILATKFHATRDDWMATQEEIVASVDRSLERLKVESVEIMQFHGVAPEDYRRTIDGLMPTVLRLQEQGKFQYIGITETYARDPRHEMFPVALEEDLFDTAMVGYNLLSPTPERTVLPICEERNVGVICMVPVRKSLSRPELLAERISDAKARGLIEKDALPDDDPLG